MCSWAELPRSLKFAALVALVAAAWAWPVRAQASCGDYVTMQSSHEGQDASPSGAPTPPSAVDPSSPSPPPAWPASPKPACQGRHCAVPPAPVTSATISVERDDVSAAGGDAGTLHLFEAVNVLFAGNQGAPPGYPSSIFHPPRA